MIYISTTLLFLFTLSQTTMQHTESDDSPGVYLRDDFLGGPTELRAPTAERAALFLDAALAGRPQGGLEPAMIFTLHVYQYSLSRKGGGKHMHCFFVLNIVVAVAAK